jgi:agmatinase
MKKFFTDAFTEDQANVIVFGVPVGKDGYKPLESLRDASWFVEFFDIDSKKNLLENARIFDSGNTPISELASKVRRIIDSKKIPLMFSNTHLISLYSLKAFDDVKLIVFDAHTDLHDRFTDEKIQSADGTDDENVNEATWLRRFCDERGKDSVMLVGLRSVSEDVMGCLNDFNYFSSNFVKNNLEAVKRKIEEFTKDSDVYVSVDIDVFDPSIAPAVDYPEPDGIFFNQFKELIRSVSGKLAGADLVCLKPVENNQVTEFLAVKVIFEILGLIK